MTAVISLLVVLTLSFLITRMGTAALTLTGVSHDLARLQSISAFSGVGFTTSESEHIVNHPVRRRILVMLMILGNAGFVTAASTLILSFTGTATGEQWLTRIATLAIGLALLWAVAFSKWVQRRMHAVMQRILQRAGRLRAYDFVELLDLGETYTVRTMQVEANDWVADKRLEELNLFQEGITVLGIHREDGQYLGVPRGETEIEPLDKLVLYGKAENIRELDSRREGSSGDEAHTAAVRDQQHERAEQKKMKN